MVFKVLERSERSLEKRSAREGGLVRQRVKATRFGKIERVDCLGALVRPPILLYEAAEIVLPYL
jgi:hypothetical protein